MISEKFPAGLLGSYYAIRHHLGFYRYPALAARYELHFEGGNVATDHLVSRLTLAVQQTALQHPALQLSVHFDSANPLHSQLVRLPASSAHSVVRFKGAASTQSVDLQDEALVSEFEAIHTEPIKDPENRPSWALTLLLQDQHWSTAVISNPTIDVVFAFHHALLDGLAALSFHRSFIANLRRRLALGTPSDVLGEEEKRRPFKMPVSMEDAVGFTGHVQPKNDDASSAGIQSHQAVGHNRIGKPKVLIHELSSTVLQGSLQFCKQRRITLTGLLHGILMGFLARCETPYTQITGNTPISMRKLTGASANDLVNHISYSPLNCTSATIERFRTCAAGSAEDLSLIVEVASTFTEAVKADLKTSHPPRILVDAAGRLPILATAPDTLSMHAGPDSRATVTYELSNLGTAETEPNAPTSDEIEKPSVNADRFIFSQCGLRGGGPTFTLNCVSTRGGALSVTITWEEGSVRPDLIDALWGTLERQCVYIGRLLHGEAAMK